MYQTTIGIPRHAAGPRQLARAGELWRIFQEVAVQASTSVGWPPQRYVDTGTAFVVYGMTATHHRQVAYGQHLQARSWVHDFRRATLTKRQIRLSDAAGPVAEQITFKRGVVGGERVVVQTRVVGSSGQGHTVLDHLLHRGAELVATGRTVRVLANGADLCSLLG